MPRPDVFDPAHGSSQAMLEWMRHTASPRGWLEGAEVLDYGCGSGVLGLCALKLGARRVTAVDMNRRALAAARVNAAANGLAPRLELRLPPVSGREGDFEDFFGDFEEEWLSEEREAQARGGDFPQLPWSRQEEEQGQQPRFRLVLANMRKNALLRCARRLVELCAPGGVVAVSGFMLDFEEQAVLAAFRAAGLRCDVDLDAPTAGARGNMLARAGYGMFWGERC